MTNENPSSPESISQRLTDTEARANNAQAVYNWISDNSERSQHFHPDNFANGLEEALAALMTQKQKERAEKIAERMISRGTDVEASQADRLLEKLEEAALFEDEIKKQIATLINLFKTDNNWGRIAAALSIFNRPQFFLISKENNWLNLVQEQAEEFLARSLADKIEEVAQDPSIVSEEEATQLILTNIPEKDILIPYLKETIFRVISTKRSKLVSQQSTQTNLEPPITQEESNQESINNQLLFDKAAEIAAAETIDLQDAELKTIIAKIKALQDIRSRYAKVANEAALSMMSAFEKDPETQGRAIDNEKIRLQIEKAQAADGEVLLLTSAISRYDRAKQEEEKDFQDVNRSNPLESRKFQSQYSDQEFKALIEDLPTFTSFCFLIKKLVDNHIIEDPPALNSLISQMQQIEGNNHKIESFVSRKANGSEDWFQEATNSVRAITLDFSRLTLSAVNYGDNLSQVEREQIFADDIKRTLSSNLHSYIARMLINTEISSEGIDMISSKVKEYDRKYVGIDQILGIINSYPKFFEATDSSYMAITKLLEKRMAQLRKSMEEGRHIDRDFTSGFIQQIENIKNALDFGFLRNDVLNYRCLGASWTKDSEGAKIPQVIERMSKIISIGKKGLDAQGVNTAINEEKETMGIGEYFDERLQWSDQMGILQQILCVMKQEMMKQKIGNGYLEGSDQGKDESRYSMEDIFGSQEKVNNLITDILEGRVNYTFYTGEPICCKETPSGPFKPIDIKKSLDEKNLGHEERAILMQEAMMLASARDFGGDATSFHMTNNLTASKLPPEITDPRIFDQPAVGAYYESRNNQSKILCNSFISIDMEEGSFFNRTKFSSNHKDGKALEKYGISAKTTIFWWWLYAQNPHLQKMQLLADRKDGKTGVNSDFEYHVSPAIEEINGQKRFKSLGDLCVFRSFDGRVLPPISHFVSQRKRKVAYYEKAKNPTNGQMEDKLKLNQPVETLPPDAYLKVFAARDRMLERAEMLVKLDDVRSKFFDSSGNVKHDAVVQEISSCNTDIAILIGYLGSFSKREYAYSKDVNSYLSDTKALKHSVDGADLRRYHEVFYHAYISFLTALRMAVPGEIKLDILNLEKGIPSNTDYSLRLISLNGAIRQGISPPETSGGLKPQYRDPIMRDFMPIDFRRRTGHIEESSYMALNRELLRLSQDPRYTTQVAKILPDYLEIPNANGTLSVLEARHPQAKALWEKDEDRLPPNPFAKKEEDKK